MTPTKKESEAARRYLRGDCNDIQLAYLVSSYGSSPERMEAILEKMSFRMPIASASKIILAYIVIEFLACLAYAVSA